MDTALLTKKFERIGARVKFGERPRRFLNTASVIRIDIGTDRNGEFFELTPQTALLPELEILDVQPEDRHLLLMVREPSGKSKYLCGHDERHWFVAGIPEKASVGTVRQAKTSLQPTEVQLAVASTGLAESFANRRKNSAFVRQGEWFFLPDPGIVVNTSLILKREPLRRGNGGKPHWAEYCYRYGGESVYVCGTYPNGLTEAQYRKVLSTKISATKWRWQVLRRNPAVFVRGRISHADHATVKLHDWHRVVMNTENQSIAMRNIAFLD